MSRRTRRILAVLGMAWVGGVVVLVVLNDNPGLTKLAFLLYGGFGLFALSTEFLEIDERWNRQLFWVQAATFVAAGVLWFLGATQSASQSVVQYSTTSQVRATLAPADIGCKDFVTNPSPTSIACAFSEWIPQRGRAGGAVVIYANPVEATVVAERCRDNTTGGGQLLYRDGQAWVASIAAYASDRRTASDIDDQEFVTRVAKLLGTDIIDC